MIVFDASVVIAFLEPADVHHDDATSLVVDLIGGTDHELALHPLTAAEVLAGFVPTGREEAAWRDIAAVGFAIHGFGDDPAAALLLARTRMQTRLKMPDAVVLATALHHQGQVASADAGLRRACLERGLLYDP